MHIKFKNGHALYLFGKDDEVATVGHAFVIASTRRSFKILSGKIENATNTRAIRYKKLVRNDLDYLYTLSQEIRNALRTSSCCILFEDKDRQIATSLMNLVLIHPGSPNRARAYVKGSATEIINKYVQFLNDKNQKKEKPLSIGVSIRVKLLVISFLIIILSLSAVIFPATSLSRKYSEILIQDYNLSLARLTGNMVESSIRNIMYRSMVQINSNDSATKFFQNNPEIIYFATIHNQKKFKALAAGFNPRYNTLYGIDENIIHKTIDARFDQLIASFQGGIVVLNISPRFKIPVVLLSEPIGKDTVLVTVVSSVKLLEIFQNTRQTEFYELMLVNQEGEIVAHSEQTKVLQDTIAMDDPVIRGIFETGIDNGSRKYIYKNIEYLASWQSIEYGNLGIVSRVPSNKIFAAIYKIQRQNIYIMLFVLTAAFLIVFIFARTISIPIIRLVKATRNIEAGNYKLDIQSKHNDEIGYLTSSFISMARGLEEKERIKNVFGKFVNPAIAEKALIGDLKLGGELREATVFFSDIRSFTSMSENSSPALIVEILNRYFTKMVDCVHSTGGIVDKFIGDAVMSHWGAITSTDNDAKNAVKSALLMRDALTKLNLEFEMENKPRISIGCGINTGQLISGQIGSQKRLEFTVIGDAVNLASRIEYLNKTFGTDILVSESTWNLIKDDFNFIKMPEIKIRGKQNAQNIYCVLGAKDDESCPRDLQELRQLVGIEFSMEQAAEIIDESSDTLIGNLKDANSNSG